ncbi:MAG: hypothetical protein R3F61_37805 [Myxococcota bacterium]
MSITGQMDIDAVPKVSPPSTEIVSTQRSNKKDDTKKDDEQPSVLNVDLEWSKKISNGL